MPTTAEMLQGIKKKPQSTDDMLKAIGGAKPRTTDDMLAEVKGYSASTDPYPDANDPFGMTPNCKLGANQCGVYARKVLQDGFGWAGKSIYDIKKPEYGTPTKQIGSGTVVYLNKDPKAPSTTRHWGIVYTDAAGNLRLNELQTVKGQASVKKDRPFDEVKHRVAGAWKPNVKQSAGWTGALQSKPSVTPQPSMAQAIVSRPSVGNIIAAAPAPKQKPKTWVEQAQEGADLRTERQKIQGFTAPVAVTPDMASNIGSDPALRELMGAQQSGMAPDILQDWIDKPTSEVDGTFPKVVHGVAALGQGLVTMPVTLSGMAATAINEPETAKKQGMAVFESFKRHVNVTKPEEILESLKEEPVETVSDWLMIVDAVAALAKVGAMSSAKLGNIGKAQGYMKQSEAFVKAGELNKANEAANTAFLLLKDPTTADIVSRNLNRVSDTLFKATNPTEWYKVTKGALKAGGNTAQEWARATLAKEEPNWKPVTTRVREAQAQRSADAIAKEAMGYSAYERNQAKATQQQATMQAQADAITAARESRPDVPEAMSKSSAISYIQKGYGLSQKQAQSIFDTAVNDGRIRTTGEATKQIQGKKGAATKRYTAFRTTDIDAVAAEFKTAPPPKAPIAAAKPVEEAPVTPTKAPETPTEAPSVPEVTPAVTNAARASAEAVETAVLDAVRAGKGTAGEILEHVRRTLPEAEAAQVQVGLFNAEMKRAIQKRGGAYEPVVSTDTYRIPKNDGSEVTGTLRGNDTGQMQMVTNRTGPYEAPVTPRERAPMAPKEPVKAPKTPKPTTGTLTETTVVVGRVDNAARATRLAAIEREIDAIEAAARAGQDVTKRVEALQARFGDEARTIRIDQRRVIDEGQAEIWNNMTAKERDAYQRTMDEHFANETRFEELRDRLKASKAGEVIDTKQARIDEAEQAKVLAQASKQANEEVLKGYQFGKAKVIPGLRRVGAKGSLTGYDLDSIVNGTGLTPEEIGQRIRDNAGKGEAGLKYERPGGGEPRSFGDMSASTITKEEADALKRSFGGALKSKGTPRQKNAAVTKAPEPQTQKPVVTETPAGAGKAPEAAITGKESDPVFTRMREINDELNSIDKQFRAEPNMEYTAQRDLTNRAAELHREKQSMAADFEEWARKANDAATTPTLEPTTPAKPTEPYTVPEQSLTMKTEAANGENQALFEAKDIDRTQDKANTAAQIEQLKNAPKKRQKAIDTGMFSPNDLFRDNSGRLRLTGEPVRKLKVALAKGIEETAALNKVVTHSKVVRNTIDKASEVGIYLSPEHREQWGKQFIAHTEAAAQRSQLYGSLEDVFTEVVRTTDTAAKFAKANLPGETVIPIHDGKAKTIKTAGHDEIQRAIDAALAESIDPLNLGDSGSPLADAIRGYRELWKQIQENATAGEVKTLLEKTRQRVVDHESMIGDIAIEYQLMSADRKMEYHLARVYETKVLEQALKRLRQKYGDAMVQVSVTTPLGQKGPRSTTTTNQEIRARIAAELKQFFATPDDLIINTGPFSSRLQMSVEHMEALGYLPHTTARLQLGSHRAIEEIQRARELYHIINDPQMSSAVPSELHSVAVMDKAQTKWGSKYKALDGRYVSPWVSSYVQGLTRFERMNNWEKAIQAWKRGKLMTIPFHVRNQVGNAAQLYFGTGALPHEVGAAGRYLATKEGRQWLHDEVIKNGLAEWHHPNEFAGEVQRGEASVRRLTKGENKAIGLVKAGGNKIQDLNDKAFQTSEGFWKDLAYTIERRRQNQELREAGIRWDELTPERQQAYKIKAIQTAHDAIFDYSTAPGWVKTLSRKTGAFATYPYKMGGLLAKTAATRPTRLIAAQRFAELTSPWVDWTYFIPYIEQYDTLVNGGETPGPVGRVVDVATQMIPTAALAQKALGLNGFTGKRTWREQDPKTLQAQDYATALYQFLSPAPATPIPGITRKGGTYYERVKGTIDDPTLPNFLKAGGITLRDTKEEAKWAAIRKRQTLGSSTKEAARRMKKDQASFLMRAQREGMSPEEKRRGLIEIRQRYQDAIKGE